MVVRPYAVLTLPAKDTVLGGLSEAGCRVELTAIPLLDDDLGSCYAVDFRVEDIRPGQAARAEERLRDMHAVFASSTVDAGRCTWTAAALVPVQNVAVPTFRLLERPPHDAAPAWVVMRDGLAQVRLRPNKGPIDGFLFALVQGLREHGVDTEVVVMDLDDEEHEQRVRGVHTMSEPLVA